MTSQEQNRIAILASNVQLPAGAPHVQDWYVEREVIIATACDRLGVGSAATVDGEISTGEPAVVGLAGPRGTGKSVVAAMILARNDVRAHFNKGIIWLPVGPGAGDRLPALLHRLAVMVHETVLEPGSRPPRGQDVGVDHENGVAYIRDQVGENPIDGNFLVVADDVWEASVLRELSRIGGSMLYTTRSKDLLFGISLMRVDEVLKKEAEAVLRRAAEINQNAPLPETAFDIIQRCRSAIMTIASVGRWGTIRGKSDEESWGVALNSIVVAQMDGEKKSNKFLPWHTSVLKVGLKELEAENLKNKELYLCLGVMPDGLAFAEEEASALLHDEACSVEDLKATKGLLSTLERWSILTQEEGGKYRVHSLHSEYIRQLVAEDSVTLDKVLARWRKHVSMPQALLSWSLEELVDIWRTIAALEGEGVKRRRPYKSALKELVSLDHDAPKILHRLALFYWLAGDYDGAYDTWTKLWKIIEQDSSKIGEECPDIALTFSTLGEYALKQGQTKDADGWFQRAFSIQAETLGLAHLKVADTLHQLAWCASETGRAEEAEALNLQALSIRVDKLDGDHPDVARTLRALGVCMFMEGRTGEAEKFHRRALKIREGNLGVHDSKVAHILYDLGRCASSEGRVEEAAELYRRTLSIEENNLGADHQQVATILFALGGCAAETGRMEDAAGYYRRALLIQEANLGEDSPDVARTIYALGGYLFSTGRMTEAEPLYRRALASVEKSLGGNHPAVADTLYRVGVCSFCSGRTEEAERYYRRALAIRVKVLDKHHPEVGNITYELGRCASKARRVAEARDWYLQTLKIEEDNLGADHPEVATVLFALGGCEAEAGRMREAEVSYRRSLAIWDAADKDEGLGVTDLLVVADTLSALGKCLLKEKRKDEALWFYERALNIQRGSGLEKDHPDLTAVLFGLRKCKTKRQSIYFKDIRKIGLV